MKRNETPYEEYLRKYVGFTEDVDEYGDIVKVRNESLTEDEFNAMMQRKKVLADKIRNWHN